MNISLIICTYNRDKYIYNTLKCIAQNKFPYKDYEIIVVNNNSTDSTEEECKRFYTDFPDTQYTYFIERNQGLSFARNKGIELSTGNILVFLDDDAYVCNNYLEKLNNYLLTYTDMMAFGGKITPLFETGKSPNWMSRWLYPLVSAINLGVKPKLFTKGFPIGANMGFTRVCINKYGNFNTLLGRCKNNLMGGEEKDFFNRLKANQEKIYYFPETEVKHVIPEKRTSKKYISEMAIGIGQSERVRTLYISKIAYCVRIAAEIIKWAASFLLLIGYVFIAAPKKGLKLIEFRWYVTKGLISK